MFVNAMDHGMDTEVEAVVELGAYVVDSRAGAVIQYGARVAVEACTIIRVVKGAGELIAYGTCAAVGAGTVVRVVKGAGEFESAAFTSSVDMGSMVLDGVVDSDVGSTWVGGAKPCNGSQFGCCKKNATRAFQHISTKSWRLAELRTSNEWWLFVASCGSQVHPLYGVNLVW
jgi:hypothetical protein